MVINIDPEEQKALNQEAEEINSRVTTPVAEEQAPEEVAQAEAEVATDVEPEVTETEGQGQKKGFQARVQELSAKAKAEAEARQQAEARAQSLEAKIAELTNPVGFQGTQSPTFNPQTPIVAEGEEITAAELNRRVAERDARNLQISRAQAELLVKQSEAVSRIKSESSEVIREYPELDPESENFNPELSEAVSEATEAYIRKNPYSASVKGFVAKLMKPYKGAVAKEVGKASENIAKQVSQAALRPTTIRKEEKSAADMSIEELEAKLGIVQS